MWNMSFSNRICNEHNKIREHKLHLERIITTKPVIDVKEPIKPSFLQFKAKKEKMEQERFMQINYENTVLLKKIIDIEKKPSPYNPVNLQVAYCPAYDKVHYIERKKKYDLDKENLVNIQCDNF
jgi:hypothetical protein